VILHGLSTYGFAARALITALGGNDAKSLRMISAKFSAPVKPGDTLETQAWEVGPGPDGTLELSFVTKDLSTGTVRGFFGGVFFFGFLMMTNRSCFRTGSRISKRRQRASFEKVWTFFDGSLGCKHVRCSLRALNIDIAL
jgi:hypothetical protein